MADVITTPVNTITRENLSVLIRNNTLNESVEFMSDCHEMETDSPVRKTSGHQPISKKLFHSPVSNSPENTRISVRTHSERSRKCMKRKQILLPDTCEKIKRAYMKECERDGAISPEVYGGMRKKVLISLFHNKEYSMDTSMS